MTEGVPQDQDVQAEKEQRCGGNASRAEPGGEDRVGRHEERQDQRARRRDVDKGEGPVGLDEEAVPDRPGQHVRRDDDADV